MIRIGISGWTYPPWRGTFYPSGLVQREELAYAARQLSSIEINGTFYSLQRPSSYASWYGQTPSDFLFAVKAPQFITHVRRLKNVSAPLANFLASGVLRLGEKLGPLLWQLPPSFAYDAERLEAFLILLPHDADAAQALARRHDATISQPWLKPGRIRRIRHAIEVRHKSFCDPGFIAQLRRHKVALVVADTAGKWPFMEDITSDFIYVRLHGDAELYVSGYTESALQQWARKASTWHDGRNPANARVHAALLPPSSRGRDVFVYFDNDVKTRAPYDAMSLAYKLKVGSKPPAAPRMDSKPARARSPAYSFFQRRQNSFRKSARESSPGKSAARRPAGKKMRQS